MNSPTQHWQRLLHVWSYFKTGRGWVALAILASLLAALTEPMIPALLKPLLDHGFKQQSFNLWLVPLALILLFGVRGLAGFVGQYALSSFTNKGLLNLRLAMFSKLLDAELRLFRNQSSSTLTNTLVYEVFNGSSMLATALIGLIKDTFTLIALVGYLLYLNWQLTLVVGLMFPAVALVVRALSKRLYRLTKASQVATDELAYVVEENVLAHRDIRLHAAQEDQLVRFSSLSEALRRLSIKSSMAATAMTPITQLLASVALSAVISMALLQNSQADQSVGAFVAFITAMLMLVAPIKHLSEVASPITRGLAALERGIVLIESHPSETGGGFSKTRADGAVSFHKVCVQFDQESLPAVSDFDLHIQPGETIALVGASGAGKTTLVSLLPRFIEASSGTIQLDGHALQAWDLGALRQQIAVVSQHVLMLNGSIAQNVCLGQVLDRAKVQDCLASANLSDFIADLPQGMDTEVGHNAMQLSGGQRQRLAIARALYKDAPILILDEATSALDAESERAVQAALARLMANRTTLVIAHKLATVQHADRIVLMHAGRILEIGSHQELLQHNGHYKQLYQSGFGASSSL
jgi:subfamily B ATP-binding cassette protein MsbA